MEIIWIIIRYLIFFGSGFLIGTVIRLFSERKKKWDENVENLFEEGLMEYGNILNEFKLNRSLYSKIMQTHGKNANNLINAIYYLLKGFFVLEDIISEMHMYKSAAIYNESINENLKIPESLNFKLKSSFSYGRR